MGRIARFLIGSFIPALALVAGAGVAPSWGQIGNTPGCEFHEPGAAHPTFPRIPICAFAGAYQDSTVLVPRKCAGLFSKPLPDSVRVQPRTITVRFWRDRKAEVRPDFGGYRVWRLTNTTDTTKKVLIRRFSRQLGDERLWHFSVADTADSGSTPNLYCGSELAHDSVVTFIDPDSNGHFVKRCKRIDNVGRCLSPTDSVYALVAPPGPHDGFRTWYAVTYESLNQNENNYEDMFIPDTLDNFARCTTPGDPNTCPNLNNVLANMTPAPVEPTGGPAENPLKVIAVPNPYRAREAWEGQGNELHFINLPPRARIRIYTVAGDLVADFEHNDPLRDFARWNLKNANGQDVASGIYMFRVEADQYSFQNRFVVIR